MHGINTKAKEDTSSERAPRERHVQNYDAKDNRHKAREELQDEDVDEEKSATCSVPCGLSKDMWRARAAVAATTCQLLLPIIRYEVRLSVRPCLLLSRTKLQRRFAFRAMLYSWSNTAHMVVVTCVAVRGCINVWCINIYTTICKDHPDREWRECDETIRRNAAPKLLLVSCPIEMILGTSMTTLFAWRWVKSSCLNLIKYLLLSSVVLILD